MGRKAVATECSCIGDNDIGIYLCNTCVSVGRKIKIYLQAIKWDSFYSKTN